MDTVTDFALPPRLIPASQPHPGGRTAMWRSEPRTSPSCSQGTETRSVATSSLNFNIKRGFCRVVGLVKTGLMLSFQAMAANIRLIRQWSRRTSDVTDPLSELIAEHFGFEELDGMARSRSLSPSTSTIHLTNLPRRRASKAKRSPRDESRPVGYLVAPGGSLGAPTP